jgi:hypothetical protein
VFIEVVTGDNGSSPAATWVRSALPPHEDSTIAPATSPTIDSLGILKKHLPDVTHTPPVGFPRP